MRCTNCPIKHLAVCAGEHEPYLCGVDERYLARRSKYYASLAGYPAPVTTTPEIPPRSSRELVVAKFQEDVSWLEGVPMCATVYDKCPPAAPRRSLPDRVTFVPRENLGREAETYLNHIVERYDSLAEVTYFVQGNPFDHSRDLLSRLQCPYDAPTSLTHQYLSHYPADKVKELDLVSRDFCGHEVRLGRADGYYVANGRADGYYVANGRTDAIQVDGRGEPTNTNAWLDRIWGLLFDCPRPDPIYFGYGSQWAVPRRNLLWKPREVWQSVRDRMNFDDPDHAVDLTPWAMETLFAYLWLDPQDFPVMMKG